jgi:Domain of unknown function (DUF5047)
MLDGGTDLLYRNILAGPHRIYTRVEVWDNTGRIDTYGDKGLPISSGSVSANLNSRVARTASIGLPRGLFPADPTGLLAPFGNFLKIFSGVEGGGGSYVWPVFVGRINDITMSSDGTVSLTAVDRAGDIQDSYFGSPQQSNINSLITDQFKQLVTAALPSATFGTFDPGAFNTTPNLIWNADRASACDDLANSTNLFWYPLANGDFVMRQVAWTAAQNPVWTFTAGDDQASVLAWSVGYSRTNVWNQITVVGELADGTTPIYATVIDNISTSPTFAFGKFGLKGQYFSVQTARTQGQALFLANAYLRQTKSLTDKWTLQMVSDASLELGDAILASTPIRSSSVQVVSAFTLSLDSKDTMSVTLQAQQPGPLNEGSI